MFDADRYYTPEGLASEFISELVLDPPQVCIDTTCGTGNLLSAASSVFESVDCLGLDRDRRAIEALKRRQPNWVLSVGDVLRSQSYSRTAVFSYGEKCDLLLLNPPFSHNGRKSFQVNYKNHKVKASTAMAHVLRGLELFSPEQGGLVVAPESLLYSETDEAARSILFSDYDWRTASALPSSTFRGARARAVIIRLVPRDRHVNKTSKAISPKKTVEVALTRGALPVHAAKADKKGLPFVHSTDIANPRICPLVSSSFKTKSQMKGKVSGWMLMLPRVGVPKRDSIVVRDLRTPIHLSDCVIALKATSLRKARAVRTLILGAWPDFVELYKGTAARYVTIRKLVNWLNERGIEVDVE